jgi:hypothetical protein
MLQEGLAGLGQLESGPFAEPSTRRASGGISAVSPAGVAHTGRAALERAREIRDVLRRRGPHGDPLLAELFDLLDRIGPVGE